MLLNSAWGAILPFRLRLDMWKVYASIHVLAQPPPIPPVRNHQSSAGAVDDWEPNQRTHTTLSIFKSLPAAKGKKRNAGQDRSAIGSQKPISIGAKVCPIIVPFLCRAIIFWPFGVILIIISSAVDGCDQWAEMGKLLHLEIDFRLEKWGPWVWFCVIWIASYVFFSLMSLWWSS